MRKILGCAIGLMLASMSFAQINPKEGYRLDFDIRGLQDTVVYLGYYYGEATYLADTAVVDGKGRFHFEGDKALPQGVYFLALGNVSLFNIAISADQHFKATTGNDDYIRNMKIEGSEDNRIFFENMLFNEARHVEANPFVAVIKDSLASEQQKQEANAKLVEVDKKVLDYQKKLITSYPNTITARWLKATQQVPIPDSLGRATDSTAAASRYRYYRKHFFDHVDLSDDALLRLPDPLYLKKLTQYLDEMIPTIPDSVFSAIKGLADRAKPNQETYKYLVWNAFIHYQTPKFMGLDKVYVDMYDYYFASGKMDFWIGKDTKESLKEYADRLRLSLIGNVAPDLIMQDANLNLKSLYKLKNRYVIIYFFDPDCGHCRTSTPKLVDFYEQNKERFDLEVYAVSSDTSMQKMKDYIQDMKMSWITVNGPRTAVGSYQKLYDVPSMPTMYIIDEHKKIIAKKPPIEVLGDFLEHYERTQKMSQDDRTRKGTI